MTLSRRTMLQASAGVVTMALTTHQARADEPIRIGFLTVKTGPLAAGGIQMEQGMLAFMKIKGNKLAGRDVQLIVADTGGSPQGTRTKAQELVERDKVHLLMGPVAAFEALAIGDYCEAQKMPTLGVAAAEDMTQRHSSIWFARATSSSGQCAHAIAHYAATELKYKRMAVIGDDFAYGHEQNGAFLRVFEDNGGKVVQKLWPPLNAPDYGTYVSQIKTDIDAVFMSFAGSNGFRFTKAFNEYGLAGKIPILGGMTAMDEAILQQTGDDGLGIITASFYAPQYDNPANREFVAVMQRDYKIDPGYYASGPAVQSAVLEAALVSVGGKIEDREALMKAVRSNVVENTVRGPVRFDDHGEAIGNVYIRKMVKQGGRYINSVIKTYPDVSQFWTYPEAAFLANPVYSRDYPPARNLES